MKRRMGSARRRLRRIVHPQRSQIGGDKVMPRHHVGPPKTAARVGTRHRLSYVAGRGAPGKRRPFRRSHIDANARPLQPLIADTIIMSME